MDPGEIFAEIERRKRRANDLRIREILWTLHYWHFRLYPQWRTDDPELIYPSLGEGGPEFFDNEVKFSIGPNNYQVSVRRQRSREFRGKEITDTETITDGTVALRVNGERVFKFEWSERNRGTQSGPVWECHLGEITRFIDGIWVLELTDLLEKVTAHETGVRNERNTGDEARRLEALKKRFGL